MSRIAARFRTLQTAGRKALVPFVTAGDPSPALTLPLMHALVGAGADIIELGVPFSDPMADGPTIQQASERALKHGVNLNTVFALVADFRQTDPDTPVILMGYLNPIESMGYEAFALGAARAGVDGVLTVDLPPEESAALGRACEAQGLDPIFLLAPTSSAERIARIAQAARGFVYYVSLRGVTGSKTLNVREVERRIAEIRVHTSLPIGVGFGISDANSAAAVARIADAVVVGSAIVRRVGELAATPDKIPGEIAAFVGGLRAAIDDAQPAKATGARA